MGEMGLSEDEVPFGDNEDDESLFSSLSAFRRSARSWLNSISACSSGVNFLGGAFWIVNCGGTGAFVSFVSF